MHAATLSIDLGASHTKVAYRKVCNPHGTWSEEASVLRIDGSPLIPSLAVMTADQNQPWIFGQTAAGLTPTRETRIFQNWKANLFRPSNDESSAESIIVAGKFFSWLRQQIESSGIPVASAETRVAMPAFDNLESKAAILARCMELNGWNSPRILRATEPHANAIGLFSEGRNVATVGGDRKINPHFGRMFGQNSYIQTARHAILAGGNPYLTTLIVDIGAFTTDIASLIFDTSSEHDGLQKLEQESYALGVINELDRPLFLEIGKKHGFDWTKLSFRESERRKRELYAGETISLLVEGFSGEIGGGTDADLIREFCANFAEQVWLKIIPFVERRKPKQVYLTGGGALIKPVADKIRSCMSQANIATANTRIGEAVNGNDRWTTWENSGESLARLATAVGGVSVILQAAGEVKRSEAEPVHIPQPVQDYVECRCRGGNKDCCYCGGRGFYKK